MLVGFRAPQVDTTGTSTVARSAADGYSPMELRKSAKAALAFSLPARRHSSGNAVAGRRFQADSRRVQDDYEGGARLHKTTGGHGWRHPTAPMQDELSRAR
jgi:hypothetical protein